MSVKFSAEFWDNILKPCPFCGGQAFIMSKDKEFLRKLDADEPNLEYPPENGPYSIACEKCGIEQESFAKLEDAISAWNKRYAEGTSRQYVVS